MVPYKMPKQKLWRNDLWEEVYHIGPISTPPSSPCLSCRLQFRKKEDDSLGHTLSSSPGAEDGTITIVDGDTYEFDIPPQVLPLEAGYWVWDFETFTELSFHGPPRTWIQGEVEVLADVSHD